MLIKKNSIIQRKFWMNFIHYIQISHASIKITQQQKRKVSKWTTFMQTWIFKRENNVMNCIRI